LVRPGRIDYKIEYKLATSDQARMLFERFFPSDRFASTVQTTTSAAASTSTKRIRSAVLTRSLSELGAAFASTLPENEFSMAELQGYLLTCKWNPEHAVDGLNQWVDIQRVERLERSKREEVEREKKRVKVAARSMTLARVSRGEVA
jgi:mitochondrial chaperone BCS1